jgi:CMP-N-acetylneuraminic acid synthetase
VKIQAADIQEEEVIYFMIKSLGIFIPARLESERLPNKQILPIGNSCIFDIACNKLESISDRFNKYVLIKDEKLIDIARSYSSIKIIRRTKDTCSEDGPLKFIFKDLNKTYDSHLMFLNPCLIFLKPETIEKVLNDFIRNNFDYATSVKKYQNWVFDKEEKSITPIDYKTLSTKSIPVMYEAAHCFHIFNKDKFLKDGMMLKTKHKLYVIDKEETIDIDYKEDYQYARWKYEKNSC